MILDVTNLDKKLLIRALYDSSSPIGMGKVEYYVRKERGDFVHDITDEECEYLLSDFENLCPKEHKLEASYYGEEEDEDNPEFHGTSAKVADYIKGVTLKLNLYRPYSDFSKVYVYSDAYDMRNGFYMFLETLIKNFPLTDFRIVDKEYDEFWDLEEMNEKHNFDRDRFNLMKIVVNNQLPNGYVDKNVLKSFEYFDQVVLDI